jgi:hypothetical protein
MASASQVTWQNVELACMRLSVYASLMLKALCRGGDDSDASTQSTEELSTSEEELEEYEVEAGLQDVLEDEDLDATEDASWPGDATPSSPNLIDVEPGMEGRADEAASDLGAEAAPVDTPPSSVAAVPGPRLRNPFDDAL